MKPDGLIDVVGLLVFLNASGERYPESCAECTSCSRGAARRGARVPLAHRGSGNLFLCLYVGVSVQCTTLGMLSTSALPAVIRAVYFRGTSLYPLTIVGGGRDA